MSSLTMLFQTCMFFISVRKKKRKKIAAMTAKFQKHNKTTIKVAWLVHYYERSEAIQYIYVKTRLEFRWFFSPSIILFSILCHRIVFSICPPHSNSDSFCCCRGNCHCTSSNTQHGWIVHDDRPQEGKHLLVAPT